jgi:hypothetical protein
MITKHSLLTISTFLLFLVTSIFTMNNSYFYEVKEVGDIRVSETRLSETYDDQKLYTRFCTNGKSYKSCLYNPGTDCSTLDETYCGGNVE